MLHVSPGYGPLESAGPYNGPDAQEVGCHPDNFGDAQVSAGGAPSASIERQDGEHAGTVVVPAQSATTRRPHIEATPCQSPQRSTVVETANTTSASYIGQSSLQQKTMTTQTEWDI